MHGVVRVIEAEYRRYRALAEGALAQVPEERLSEADATGGNSLATICWHLSGNLASRFTDFLRSDGEKPWRHREEEFSARVVSRAELAAKWSQGWEVLFATLGGLDDGDLGRTVTIRGRPLAVHEALLRSLAHVSYHVGQVVFLARSICGPAWQFLSIPPGGSEAYNANPEFEKPAEQAARVGRSPAS